MLLSNFKAFFNSKCNKYINIKLYRKIGEKINGLFFALFEAVMKLNSFIYVLLLAVSVLTHKTVEAQSSCINVFKKFEFQHQNNYIILTKGQSSLFAAQYAGTEIKDGNRMYKFKNLINEEQTLYYRDKDIVSIKTAPSSVASNKKQNLFLKMIKLEFFNFLAQRRKATRHLDASFRLAKASSTIEIYSHPFFSRKKAKHIAEKINEFDQMMESLQFKIPKLTRVIVGRRKLLNLFEGSYATANFIPIKGKSSRIITLEPEFFNLNAREDQSIYLHERTHTILFENYHYTTGLFKHSFFHEAFADFFSAHFNNNPSIGTAKSPIRNIETKQAFSGSSIHNRDHIIDMTSSYHNNSMLLSNIIWKLRQKIGVEGINSILKPYIDEMDTHINYYSKFKYYQHQNKTPYTYESIMLEFALAMLFKMNQTDRFVENSFILNEAEKIGFSKNNIINLASELNIYKAAHKTLPNNDYRAIPYNEVVRDIIAGYGPELFGLLIYLSSIN